MVRRRRRSHSSRRQDDAVAFASCLRAATRPKHRRPEKRCASRTGAPISRPFRRRNPRQGSNPPRPLGEPQYGITHLGLRTQTRAVEQACASGPPGRLRQDMTGLTWRRRPRPGPAFRRPEHERSGARVSAAPPGSGLLPLPLRADFFDCSKAGTTSAVEIALSFARTPEQRGADRKTNSAAWSVERRLRRTGAAHVRVEHRRTRRAQRPRRTGTRCSARRQRAPVLRLAPRSFRPRSAARKRARSRCPPGGRRSIPSAVARVQPIGRNRAYPAAIEPSGHDQSPDADRQSVVAMRGEDERDEYAGREDREASLQCGQPRNSGGRA